jgi:glutamate-5-semialdehyde dehydrogenase
MQLIAQLQNARVASHKLALMKTTEKNTALRKIAINLKKNFSQIELANAKDLRIGKQKRLGEKLDRLKFDKKRILESSTAIRQVIKLPDPVGQILETAKPRAKFFLQRITVPFGVIAMIYESRPNVTIDAAVLALKSGNAVILRGSSDALHSNRAIVKILRQALIGTKIPPDAIQLVDSPDRKIVQEILQSRGKIDLVIPRGGKKLIELVSQNAQIPVIETGASVVHIFVDEKINIEKASKIVLNSKLRRVSICNAVDTLVLHERVAKNFLLKFLPEFCGQKGVLHAEKSAKKFLPTLPYSLLPDFDREWLSRDLNLKIVKNFTEAIDFIRAHSLGHTEAIISENSKTCERFLAEIDAACVYANLSTQFSDGGEFGLGAEIGISTQKMHARGPFALESLVTWKWVGRSNPTLRVGSTLRVD